ncbi:MAG: ATP-binding protein, partial [Anaerolineae bacterium]|nr:ATP-binding protein [Anaerolineae bacterium]
RAWAKRMHDLTASDDQNVLREDSTFAVESLVWAVANEWRRIAEHHHIELQVDIKVRGLSIHGDAKRLSWALGALVDNAIKYTPVGGLLMIQVRPPEDGNVVIRVRDNGVGIKREELPQVFGRFFRGTPETADGRPLRVPGMGQGLTLAKQIVEAHGGEIVVKSRPGSGTAVYVHLPIAEA